MNQKQKQIVIVTRDSKTLKIDKKLAFRTSFIKQMFDDRQQEEESLFDDPVPLDFDEKIVSKVFEFIRHESDAE